VSRGQRRHERVERLGGVRDGAPVEALCLVRELGPQRLIVHATSFPNDTRG
jgi:hypothetical protein